MWHSSGQLPRPPSGAAPSSRLGGGRLQKGAVLGLASATIGLLTTLCNAVIDLSSDMLADMRHGVCVARFPGETQPRWQASVGGGWRPYDRMRCCGGSEFVDHATQECRALSIIKHSTRKRLAYPIDSVVDFGMEFHSQHLALSETAVESRTSQHGAEGGTGSSTVASEGEGHRHEGTGTGGSGVDERSHGHDARAAQVRELVGIDAQRVRAHMSHLFAPNAAERWAEESAGPLGAWKGLRPSLAEESAELAVNDGVVQTQTESAGSLAPTYEWVPWERVLMARGPSAPLLIYVAGTGLLGLLAALVTRCHPAARGSGIPEVKATVAGLEMPQAFQAQTLAAKVVALALCVGAGLALGKEGPMIHIGACWGMLLAVPISRLKLGGPPIEATELVCIGAAAGVAAAFGAPLAGVLFAVEELGTTLPTGLRYSTMLCAFGSAVVASLTMKGLDLTRSQRLTLFEIDYKQAWAPWEALPFCLLGVFGGVMGGGFIMANEAVHRLRLRAEREGRWCWYLPASFDLTGGRLLGSMPRVDARVLEVVFLAVFTGLSNYPHLLTRMLQDDAIRALFSQCPAAAPAGGASRHDTLGLCGADSPAALCDLMRLLLGAAALRFMQTTVTSGALTPAGLFVPSLYMGACVGRALGGFLKYVGMTGAQGAVEPGIYAMVGAGAMMAGVTRLTLCLAVVLFELTGGLTYVVPFMLAVLIAKWTGDVITNGRSVYDVHAELKGFPKVEEHEEVRLLNATLRDLCGPAADCAAEGAAAAGDAGPPAFWVSAGNVWGSDILAHARSAGSGFVVLSLGPGDAVEVLGWARSGHIVAQLSTPKAEARAWGPTVRSEKWFRLVPAQRQHLRDAQPAAVEDLSQALEADGVVRVRGDCPLQTAFCVFRSCPGVRALVSIGAAPQAARTVTREFFAAQLLHSSLFPCPAGGALRCAGKAGPAGLAAAEGGAPDAIRPSAMPAIAEQRAWAEANEATLGRCAASLP